VTAVLAVAGFASVGTIGVGRSGAAAIHPPVCFPGEVTLPVTADARVSRRHPNRRYGTASRWKVNHGPATLRSFVDFDLPAIPIGCSVTKATLEVNGRESGHPHPATAWPGAYVNFAMASGRWAESRITWNNMPPGIGCFGWFQDWAASGGLEITLAVEDAYRCLENGRLDEWNGLKLRGWSPHGRPAHWRYAVESRESAHPPVVHISWDYDTP
jgi:hypothetical protein